MIPIEFDRTVCACSVCVGNCKSQPGYLIPGDAERMAATLGKDPKEFLVASPGALVAVIEGGNRRTFHIGTITPAFENGRCVLLGPDDRCTVHGVAPFGCAYFDCKMSASEGQNRSSWGLHQILDSNAYKALRSLLPLAKNYRPKGY